MLQRQRRGYVFSPIHLSVENGGGVAGFPFLYNYRGITKWKVPCKKGPYGIVYPPKIFWRANIPKVHNIDFGQFPGFRTPLYLVDYGPSFCGTQLNHWLLVKWDVYRNARALHVWVQKSKMIKLLKLQLHVLAHQMSRRLSPLRYDLGKPLPA